MGDSGYPDDRHDYFAEGVNGNLIDIIVVEVSAGLHLRSNQDSTEANNLDSLDGFQPPAWDIALTDTKVFAVHTCLVPHGTEGQVLMFSGDEHDRNMADAGDWRNTRVYGVAQNRIISCNSPNVDFFCCGHAFLASGHPFVAGGTEIWRGTHAGGHQQPREHWGGAWKSASYGLSFDWDPRADMLPEPEREGNAESLMS